VERGFKFILDHIVDILKLIAILTIGFFCFPLLKKLWNYIKDILEKGEERQKAYDAAKRKSRF
jgi:hypothetical protein